jgi:4-oxalocrotonate tautomerase
MAAKGVSMPFVEVKVFEDELSREQARALIEGITKAVTEVTSDKLRDVTWVTISEVKSGSWGVGGKALGLDDVKRLIASD